MTNDNIWKYVKLTKLFRLCSGWRTPSQIFWKMRLVRTSAYTCFPLRIVILCIAFSGWDTEVNMRCVKALKSLFEIQSQPYGHSCGARRGLSGEGASHTIVMSHTFRENVFRNVAGGQEFNSKLAVNHLRFEALTF